MLIQSTIINSSAGRPKNNNNDVDASVGDRPQQTTTDEQDVMVRKYGEVFLNTLSSVASVLEYPKGIIFIVN